LRLVAHFDISSSSAQLDAETILNLKLFDIVRCCNSPNRSDSGAACKRHEFRTHLLQRQPDLSRMKRQYCLEFFEHADRAEGRQLRDLRSDEARRRNQREIVASVAIEKMLRTELEVVIGVSGRKNGGFIHHIELAHSRLY
jgi:hypothetical protein